MPARHRKALHSHGFAVACDDSGNSVRSYIYFFETFRPLEEESMLQLFWIPQAAGAPDDPAYAAARDTLLAARNGPPLQAFSKTQLNFVAATQALRDHLTTWAQARPDPTAPIFLMVHGYQYNPSIGSSNNPDDPFNLVYGYPGTPVGPGNARLDEHLSWLPLVGECDSAGNNRSETAIAFAWVSEAGIAEYGRACWSIDYQYAAFDLAPAAAKALAAVLDVLGSLGPPVRVLAHSLGTRTTSQAIGLLASAGRPATLDRVVLLDGAEYCVDAAANFAQCAFDVFAVANRKDEVLSLGMAVSNPVRGAGTPEALVIGRDGLGANSRWLDLQLDKPALVTWFAGAQAPNGRTYALSSRHQNSAHHLAGMEHWTAYTNDGNRAFVHDLLHDPDFSVANFRASGVPDGVQSAMYGQFNGRPVPATPARCRDRQGVAVAGNDVNQGSG
jgi:hypothetical protein